MTAVESCPAHRYDGKDGQRVVCLLDERSADDSPNRQDPPWALVCLSCWRDMLDGRARRMEWTTEP